MDLRKEETCSSGSTIILSKYEVVALISISEIKGRFSKNLYNIQNGLVEGS